MRKLFVSCRAVVIKNTCVCGFYFRDRFNRHKFDGFFVGKAVDCLCREYPGSLQAGLYAKDLNKDLFNRIQYLQGRELTGKEKTRDRTSSRKALIGTSSYGIPPGQDLPDELPAGESPESQNERKSQLQHMAALADINWPKAEVLMRQTFSTQRNDINEELSMEDMLEAWPFIGKVSFTLSFFIFFAQGCHVFLAKID